MWKWIKVPKGVALLAFLLPWMTVSCQGTPLAKATGFGLAFGKIEALGEQAAGGAGSEGMNILLVLALLAIVAGIVVNFVLDRKGAVIALGTSVLALVLILVAKMQYSTDSVMAKAAQGGGGAGGPDAQILKMLEIQWHLGFYLTLVALAIAAVMAGLVMAGKDAQATEKLSDLAGDAQQAMAGAAASAKEAVSDVVDKIDGDDKEPK